MPTCYRHPDRETHIRCQRCEKSICPDCMNDAAVGFQCPGCVAEGRRSTRSGRATYGGRRSDNPALTSLVLLATNVGVWFAILATGWERSWLIPRLALIPSGVCGSQGQPGAVYRLPTEQACATQTQVAGDGTWYPGVADGAVWQLLTSAFTHVEIWHVAANMIALWFLGPQLEAALGRARFLALYLTSALAGSALVYATEAGSSTTLGASGAIFGLLGGLMVVAFKVNGNISTLLPWLLLNAAVTVLVPNISWQGHLGGFVGGALVAAAVVYSPQGPRRSLVQWSAVAALVALLAVAVVLRTLALT